MKIIRVLFIATLCMKLSLLQAQTLTLEQCIEQGLQHSIGIQIKNEQLYQAQRLSKSAFTQFLPSFGVSASYIRMNKQFQLLDQDLVMPVVSSEFYDLSTGTINPDLFLNPQLMPSAFVINPETGYPYTDVNGNPLFHQYAWLPADQLTFGQKNNTMFNAAIAQPIYTGGKIRQIYKISQINEKIAVNSLSLEKQELVYEIENMYWSLITLQEKYKLAKTYKLLLDTLVKDIENYIEEGIVLNNDYLKATIKLNEVELNIMKTEHGIQLSKMALCQKIGLPLHSFFEPADTVIPAEYLVFIAEDLSRDAIQNRQELKILKNSVELAEAGVSLMRSRFLPNIGFMANYMYTNPNPYMGFSNSFGGDYTLGVAMQVPIFHWGDKQHTLAAAKTQHHIAQLQLEDTRQLITLQSYQAVQQLDQAWKQLQLTEKSLEHAKENLRIMQDNFQEGMCKMSDILEAHVLWQEAYSNHIDAKAQYRKQIIQAKKTAAIQ
jgi:outer membrane protein TolC